MCTRYRTDNIYVNHVDSDGTIGSQTHHDRCCWGDFSIIYFYCIHTNGLTFRIVLFLDWLPNKAESLECKICSAITSQLVEEERNNILYSL